MFCIYFRASFYQRFKVPLDEKFTQTYVASGRLKGQGGENSSLDDERGNIASFVRKTKELLLSEDVLKEVEASTPGDKVPPIVFILWKYLTLRPICRFVIQ